MRSLAPAETLVYLETNDLAAALQPIVDSKPFTEVAKSRPDFSALKGVQLAVAVTGFDISEEKLTDEHSIGRIRPRFVAVADTHAWNFQAVGFAEKKLGAFVANIYDSEQTLEKSDKSGGKYFTWTSKNGRKAYALVIDSLIYFGNDETAIDNCLVVRRGEADSIAKTGKVSPTDPVTLASGYVSTDGIAQIANIVGLKFASEVGEDSEVQSAIARILPQLLRNSITEVSWTATKTDQGIEDKYLISMPSDLANVFNETMEPAGQPDTDVLEQLTPSLTSMTFYNVKDPRVGWRSVLLVAQKQTDPLAGKIIGEFSGLLFEPFGVRDVEMFLSAIGPTIVTAKLEADGERSIVIARVRDAQKLKHSLSAELERPKPEEGEQGVEIWGSGDEGLSAAFPSNWIILGDTELVLKCAATNLVEAEARQATLLHKFGDLKAAAITVASDNTSAAKVADVLAEIKLDDAKATSNYVIQTRFTKTGIDRRTTSDFGLIGSIIAQLGQD